MVQKFKRGNLVKVLVGHQIWQTKNGETNTVDIAPENIGRNAIIEYSYSEKYGDGRQSDRNSYSIVWADNGSSEAWKDDNELEFIEEGGENLLAEAFAKREESKKANTDINQIVKTWEEKQGNVNSETILFLFDKIGFVSSFLMNGEFFALHSDWATLYPLFNTIFAAKTEQNVLEILNSEYKHKDKIIDFFNEIQSVKSHV